MTAITETPSRSLRRAWLSLLAVVLGILVVQLDGTVVAIANPAIAADLGADLAGIQWVTTAYLLVLAGLLIPAGNVADRIGRKKAFLVGIGGFSLASLLCGLAPNVELLIGARVLQAVFGALLGPAALAVVRAAFPPEKLPAAFGVFGSASSIALGVGPLLLAGDVVRTPVAYADGDILALDGPGLGVEVDEAAIRAWPPRG